MTKKQSFLTVVYTINDGEAFSGEMERIQSLFMSSEKVPWAITAMSKDHELNRLALIEEALFDCKISLIESIIGDPDIGNKEIRDLQ